MIVAEWSVTRKIKSCSHFWEQLFFKLMENFICIGSIIHYPLKKGRMRLPP